MGEPPRWRDGRLHLGVAQQVVVDLLAALELDVGLVLRGEHPRVTAVPGVVVGDVVEVADPPVDAEQVERGRPDEEIGCSLVRKNVRISEMPSAARAYKARDSEGARRGPGIGRTRRNRFRTIPEPPAALGKSCPARCLDRPETTPGELVRSPPRSNAGEHPGSHGVAGPQRLLHQPGGPERARPGRELDAHGPAYGGSTYFSWPWIPEAGANIALFAGPEPELVAIPARPGTRPVRPATRVNAAPRRSESTAHKLPEPAGRQDPWTRAVRRRRGTAPPSSSSCPNRARSRVVVAQPTVVHSRARCRRR